MLSVANEKVRMRVAGGTWYEFGLERILGRVHNGIFTAISAPSGTFDEYAVLTYGSSNYRLLLEDIEDRRYLTLEQEPTVEAATDEFTLKVNGLPFRPAIVRTEDSDRNYLDWINARAYSGGNVRQKLTAKFKGAGKNYTMRVGDDARDMIIVLTENGAATTAPIACTLKAVKDGVLRKRSLEDLGGNEWGYRYNDDDFDSDFAAGTYQLQVYGEFEDGSNATWPTAGNLSLTITDKFTDSED
jgi:hypothetical protein